MTRNLWGRLTTGGIIILIGIVLLLSTTGTVAMRSVWGWIAALFVLVGVWALVASNFRNLVGPVMVIAIAGTFLLRNLGVIPDGVIGTWWPLFVVLFGVLVVLGRSRRRQRARLDGTAGGEVTVVSVFGSDARRLGTDRFSGAELITVFGDSELDLRKASVRTPPAVVEVVSVFGDAALQVPEDWDVHVEVLNVFGETIDRRPRSDDRPETGDHPELILTGVSIFGDVTIRD